MNNTAGSYALLGCRAPHDSTVAAKVRRAGAVILGKTNMSEWASFRSLNTSSGWSPRGGQTEGPYFPGQDPSGSFSGSAVAAALGLAAGALGTETSGSILAPASQNNLVGIKPTVGLTSRYLVVPISQHQDTVGPMARTVKDAAHILSAIAGEDAHDNYTSAIPFPAIPNYADACNAEALRGRRIGVPRNLIDLSGEEYLAAIIPQFDTALDLMKGLGATVVDDVTLPGYDALARSTSPDVVLQADFNSGLSRYMSHLRPNVNSIRDVSELRGFVHRNAHEEYPFRDTLRWDAAVSLGHGNDSPHFWGNYTTGLHFAGQLGILGALRNLSLDALVVPTPFAPFLPSLLGTPVVTVPLGRFPDDTPIRRNGFNNLVAMGPNFPYGLSFIGEAFDEFTLIALAYAFEQKTLVRATVSPYLRPRTRLSDVVAKRKNRD